MKNKWIITITLMLGVVTFLAAQTEQEPPIIPDESMIDATPPIPPGNFTENSMRMDRPGERGRRGREPRDSDDFRGEMRERHHMGNQPPRFNREQIKEKIEELTNFIKQYEPSLYDVLMEYKEDNPDAFTQRLPTLMRVYVPIMEEMETNPDMAMLNLDKVRMKGQLEQALNHLREAEPDQRAKAQVELHEHVNRLFDLSIEQQKLTLSQWRQRLEQMQQWQEKLEAKMDAEQDDALPEDARERERDEQMDLRDRASNRDEAFQRPQGQRGQRFMNMAEKRRDELERQIDKMDRAIDQWQQQRDIIIQQRVQQLLSETPPFPW